MLGELRVEQIAFQNGYRVSKNGKLYNPSGKICKLRIDKVRARYDFKFEGRSKTFTVMRLQAYQKFGDELYNFVMVDAENGNQQDCSFNNIILGKGSERITKELKALNKEERAYRLGYTVDINGNLLLCGNNVNDKLRLTNRGYLVFDIPMIKHKMEAVLLHRLHAYQKFGVQIYGSDVVVRHLNDVKRDNTFNNIAIGTAKDNSADIKLSIKAQLYLKSAKKQIKYPVPLRNRLRRAYTKGERVCDLSRDFNIPYSTVKAIVQNISII